MRPLDLLLQPSISKQDSDCRAQILSIGSRHSPADKGGAGAIIGIPVVGVPASVGARILQSKRIDLMWDADDLPVSG